MQPLFEFLIKNLQAMWPIRRVNEWQSAMLVRGGIIVRELRPGLHWCWPFYEQVTTWAGVEVGLDLENGSITTRDGHAVTLSANIGYRITSLAQMYRALWNTEKSLRLFVLGHIGSECAKISWEELRSDRAALELRLLGTLNALVNGWGCEIRRVLITDCVLARAHRHYVDGMAKP